MKGLATRPLPSCRGKDGVRRVGEFVVGNAYQLVLAELAEVNDGDGSFRGINLGGIERDELHERSATTSSVSSSRCAAHLVNVDGRSEVVVGQNVVVPHTDLTEVTGMVLVEVGSVVVLTTGLTSTTRRLSVLADTTVTGRDVSSVLSGVGESGRHLWGEV